ncbi:MAG: DNA photolyase [Gammaproteobacteria bacterium]
MIETLYIEDDVATHAVTQRIRRRFPAATVISIERYGEVFNRKAQNFRLQKRNPALILARKHERQVLPAPPGYGLGAPRNYYISHMLNCVYDCRYCFLQGMYRSAHYVLFVNYVDFQTAMAETLASAPAEPTFFFTGYDCDSLALEPVSGYVADLLPFCEQYPGAGFELRTKSTQIRTLLNRPALANVVIAYSFTPAPIAAALEHKAPSVERRIAALCALAERGWPVGLRFDPLIYCVDFRLQYRELFRAIFARVPAERIHSVTWGPFRLPKPFFQAVAKLYPDEPLFANQFAEHNGVLSYPPPWAQELREFCVTELARYVPAAKLFSCEF